MFWGVRWGINKDFSLSQPIKKGGKVGKLGERWGKSNIIQAQKEKPKQLEQKKLKGEGGG
mgnify:CR=1 FL=1